MGHYLKLAGVVALTTALSGVGLAQSGNTVTLSPLQAGNTPATHTPPGVPGLKFSGTSTAGANYRNQIVRIEIGNYQLLPDPNNPNVFKQTFVRDPNAPAQDFFPTPPSNSVGSFSGWFTGLTSGKSYVVKATATYTPLVPGGPPPLQPQVLTAETSRAFP